MRRIQHLLTALLLTVLCNNTFAFGEKLMEQLIRSDFIYDKGQNNAPFIPIGYLHARYQDELHIDQLCAQNSDSCDVQVKGISQGFGLPVWVGQKHALIVAETLDVDTFSQPADDFTINTGGVLVAVATQHSNEWQSGAFVYNYWNFGGSQHRADTNSFVAGMVGRYRHSARVHSYWGAVLVDTPGDDTFYPYVGVDWFINDQWSLSALIPWPTLTYAPTHNQMIKLGALSSGNSWSANRNSEVYSQDFSQLDLGISFEQRLSKIIWGGVSVGYSGLGRLTLNDNADADLQSDISSTPYFKLTLDLRPL